jgi:hypothetical protein
MRVVKYFWHCAAIAIFLSCYSVASYAGFFDNIRMALGGTSIIFIEPPSSQEMVNYRQLVLQLNPSKPADPLISILETKLTNLRINQAVYFKQVTFTPPPMDVLKEQKWALVEISTNQWITNESSGNETRTQCPKGKIVCKDSDAAHFTVSCRTRAALVSAKISIKDTLSKATLVTDVASDKEESKICQGEGGNLEAPESLLGKAADAVANKLMVKFIPTSKKQASELIEDDSSLPDSSAKLKQAYRLAASGNIQTALKIYNQLIAGGISNGVVLFNAAYCEHAQGHYKNALELYKKALSAPNAPSDTIEKLQIIASDFVAAGIDSATD